MRKATQSITLLTFLLMPALATARPCPDPPCVPCGQIVDLKSYFLPSYPGWQNAKRIWTYQSGGQDCFRFFQYGPNKYELIKNCTGTSTETYEIISSNIYVTSEMGTPLGSQPRVFNGNGLYWLPTAICTNRATFQVCHQGETFINATSCLTTGSSSPHCARYRSRVEFEPTRNYGGNLGVIDTIVKVDKLDNGNTERYYYGLGRGLLRWEHYSSSGQLLNWGQQTSEIPNSPITHNSCQQP